MGMVDDKLNETAVYWPIIGVDKFGKPRSGTPVEIACHWEDVTQVYTGSDGNPFVSRSVVYTNQVLKRRGYLFYGDLASAPANPLLSDDCFEIRLFNRVPSVQADDRVYDAVL